jgi:hypothetical protein
MPSGLVAAKNAGHQISSQNKQAIKVANAKVATIPR